MRRPVDISTRHSVDFIEAHARKNCDVLEIGCGEGDVAQNLQSAGFNVTAIDSDGAAVTTARDKGVNAAQARWPEYESGKMDVVLFTRSLHHIHNLESAVSAAQTRLCEDGVLLIEDFAFDAADERTSHWFVAQLQSKPVARLLTAPQDSFAGKMLSASDPHTAWHSDHDHDLHSIKAMEAAIAARLNIRSANRVPYLYRYLVPALPETAEAAAVVEDFFNSEEQMIASGAIIPIGRRIVALLNPKAKNNEH